MFDDYCGFDYDMYVVQCRIDHSEISKHEEFPVLLVKFFAWNSSEIWHSIAFHPSKKRKMYTYKWPYHAGKLHPLLNLDRKSLFLVQYTADFYDEVFRYIEGKPTWEMSKEAHESGYVPMNFHYVFMDLFYLAYADHDALMKLYLARLVWNSRLRLFKKHSSKVLALINEQLLIISISVIPSLRQPELALYYWR